MRGFLRVLLFTVVGPIIGLLAFCLMIGLYTLLAKGSTRDFIFGPELFTPGPLIATYTIGAVPALLTGVGSMFIARWKYGWKGWLASAGLGGFVSLVGGLSLFGAPTFSGSSTDNSLLTLMLTLTGAAAGFICQMLFEGLAALTERKAA